MTTALSETIRLFVNNTQAIKDGFPFQGSMLRRLGALLYTSEHKEADCVRIREAMQLVKAHTSPFSMFRGTTLFSFAAMLSLRDHPEELMKDAVVVYQLLKAARFHASMYLVFAALQIAMSVPRDAQQDAVQKTRSAYEAVRSMHPFLSGDQSVIYAALIGSSAQDAGAAIEKAERLFLELKPVLAPKSEALSLCMLLSLSGNDQISHRVLQIQGALEAESLSFRRHYLLPMLGVLASCSPSPTTLAADIAETAASLRAQNGFGGFFVAKQELLLLSASLVICVAPEALPPLNTALLGGVTGMLIAQQVAIAASAGAAAAASASSSSS